MSCSSWLALMGGITDLKDLASKFSGAIVHDDRTSASARQ
jgi:hypothetical protein